MDVEGGQLGEVPVEAQGHEEPCVLIGQLGHFGFVVDDPGRVDLGGGSDLEAGGHAVVEAGPAGHVGGHIDVPTVQIHRGVPRGSTACRGRGDNSSQEKLSSSSSAIQECSEKSG